MLSIFTTTSKIQHTNNKGMQENLGGGRHVYDLDGGDGFTVVSLSPNSSAIYIKYVQLSPSQSYLNKVLPYKKKLMLPPFPTPFSLITTQNTC